MDTTPDLPSVAVLMTCHNRRETTLGCLETLFGQVLPGGVTVTVFLVDDGSSDGTAAAVGARFPAVRLIPADGSLYWCGGTERAWQVARQEDYDAYLWLNDDVTLVPGAVAGLWRCARWFEARHGHLPIVVGSCRDPRTGDHAYGGRVRRHRWCRLPDRPLPASARPRLCDTMNGNLVWVPRSVVERIGTLSPRYRHAFGDTDYGLRARRAGIPVLVAPGYLGWCQRNDRPRRWTDRQVPLRERWLEMRSPLGLPPRQWLCYVRAHTGWCWPWYFCKPLVRLLWPGLWQWRSSRVGGAPAVPRPADGPILSL